MRSSLSPRSQLPILLVVVVIPLVVSSSFITLDRYQSRRHLIVENQLHDAKGLSAFVKAWVASSRQAPRNVVRMDLLAAELASLRMGSEYGYTVTDSAGRTLASTEGNQAVGSLFRPDTRTQLVCTYPVSGLGWAAHVSSPLRLLREPIYVGLLRMLAVTLASLAVAVALARWLSRSYIRPLQILESEMAERLVRAQEDERKRLAREIHDWINHYLVGMFYQLQAAEPAEAEQCLQSVSTELREANVELRRIMNDLHPHLLEEEGLRAACVALTVEFQARTGIECRMEVGVDEAALGDPHKLSIFRILQEALANVGRHSQAGSVFVSLTEDATDLHIIVSDDGVGMHAQPAPERSTGGLGLASMKERAASLGGRLVVTSSPGRGTTVEGLIPKGGESLDAR